MPGSTFRFLKYVMMIVFTVVLVALVMWAALAIWFDTTLNSTGAGLLSLSFVLLVIGVLLKIRPFYRAQLLVFVLFLMVFGWWWQIKPSNTREWPLDVAQLPYAEIAGSQLTLHNVRNFDYQSETRYTPHWEKRIYDLDAIRGVDLFMSYWGSPHIAHTIVSWEFGDGTHVAISIETRKERGEEYSTVRGFFRQYELYYVVADERDVVRLRTNFRNETVYLYRINEDPQFARALLIDYLEEINRLAANPKWYNALTHNCTTTIRHHRQSIGAAKPWDWRILVNGHLDEAGYENGIIDTSLPFAEIKKRSRINERAIKANDDPQFSAKIRAIPE